MILTDITIRIVDNVYAYIETNEGIILELVDHFAFHPPNYQFMRTYKNHVWDGYIRMMNKWNHQIYIGLIPYVKAFADQNEYTFSYPDEPVNIIDRDTSKKFMDDLNIHSDGKSITPYSYQYDGLYETLRQKRVTLLSPTASGKSLIIYAIIRHILTVERLQKVLVIVPTVSLTEQLKGDFKDYSSVNGWDAENNCHLIYSGQEKNSEKSVIISTWQSVYKMSERYFSQFDAVIVDEAHHVKATSLIAILEKCQCEYRIGLTATIDDAEAHKFVIEGLLGRTTTLATTKQLMDSGEIAKLKINSIIFLYPDSECQEKRKYPDEIDFLITHPKRNRAIINLAGNLKENTLLLFLRIKHGEYLYKTIKEKYPDRKVFLVYGAVEGKIRNEIRAIMEQENDAIVVASYGTFSVGINIKKIMHIILASPTKAKIKLLQSIGRGLRLHKEKEKLKLWDISDDLSWKKRKNFTLKHFLIRLQIYIRQEFDYQIKKIRLK